MRYRMLKSRRQFLVNVVFGGAAFALSPILRAANDNTTPLVTTLMPQPDATIIQSVAFSPLTARIAVSAGPDDEQTGLYVNSPRVPDSFKPYWLPDTEVHGVTSLAWSHNENSLAFIGISGSRTTKTGEVWLYILEVASGEIRKVLKIGEQNHDEKRQLVNVHEDRAVLAWFGDNKLCVPTRGKSIIAVDCKNGHIETLVSAQSCKILGPVSVSSNKLRFLKMRSSGEGWQLEPCEFDGSKVISQGVIPITADRISAFSWLSADGKYAFVGVKEKTESILDKIIVFDLSHWASVKEIPSTAKSNSETYIYIPFTVLEGKQLVLFEIQMDERSLKGRRRLCSVNL